MSKPESVQYFQFDQEGNMYMYPAGAGITGIPKLVRPGNELTFSGVDGESEISSGDTSQNFQKVIKDMQISQASSQREYNLPLKDDEMEDLSHKNFSYETNKKIRWVLKMFREWRSYRNSSASLDNIECDLDNKESISIESLTFAVPHFITEVKKLDGSDFPGKTLYDIVIFIQFHLESIGFAWKLLNQDTFKDVRFTLDNLMKLRTSQGIGVSVRQAAVLSGLDEEELWCQGLLGWANPENLLNTVIYLIKKGFALRAGKEHHCLRSPDFQYQLKFHRDEEGVTFLRYTEDIGLKTNKGGLKHRKVEPKQVDLYPVVGSDRCPLKMINFYLSKLPANRKCSSFYLQPKRKFTDSVWYLDRPAGQNKLREVIKTLCKKAELPGFYSNHSLRSTSAMKLYRNNVDEQLIQEITGHRSLAVRSYKRTSDQQRKVASNLLFS